MPTPQPFGVFHAAWLLAALIMVVLCRNLKGEKATERVFAIYGWTALALEALKQFSWSFAYNPQALLVFDYQWYAAPFQLCTTPAYVAALYPFFGSAKVRGALRAYLAYFTLLASIAVALIPNTIYVDEVLVNVHTSFLHMGGLFASLWLLVTGRVQARRDFRGGYLVFLIFAGIAFCLNIAVYNLFHLSAREGAAFDMFYISPYYLSTVPVFSALDGILLWPVFLLVYLLAFLLGGTLIALLEALARRLVKKAASA